MSASFTIRRATGDDLPAVARLAARLVRLHHALDARRFLCEEPIEPGYERWFRHELANPKAVVLVADRAGAILGYAYGRMEARDWNALLDACGWLHDVYVDEEARTSGVGTALVEATARELRSMGAPRLLLQTAHRNEAAQRVFEKLGFRRTMVEMTRELD